MKKGILNGLIFGVSAFITFVIGLFITKASWQTTNPGTIADTSLYINGNGNLTKDKWNNIAEKTNNSTVPSGSIVAFNLTTCPTGWSSISQTDGKTIIGVGNGTDSNSTIQTFSLLQSDGEYTHKLITNEIPAHTHQYLKRSLGNPDGNSLLASIGFKGATNPSDSAGGDQYHNNLQPYVALLYCIKN